MTELLVIGWDGASKRFLDRFDLSFYESLDYSGYLLPEKAYRDIPIDSGTAWTTITTGLGVSEHRILSINNLVKSGKFLNLTRKVTENIPSRFLKAYLFYGPNKLLNLEGRNPRSTDVPYRRLWDFIDGETLALGVPLTYPAWEHKGVMLSGIPAPLEGEMPEAYPVEYNEYRKRYNAYYYIDEQWPLEKESRPNLEKYKESVYSCNENAFNVIEELSEENDFEMIFAVMPLLDDMLHALDPEKEEDEIEEAYKWIDNRTKELVEKIEPEHVLIVSDHGMMSSEDSLSFDHGEGMRMDHDSTDGIWASDIDLGLEVQKDLVPTVLREIFEIEFSKERFEMNIPDQENLGDEISDKDEEEVKERLKNLGYVSD